MHKRLIFMALMALVAGSMMAQEVATPAEQRLLGIHPYKQMDPDSISPELANWSLFFNLGGNAFDGDFTSEQKHVMMAPSVGLGFEYSFNPTWGIGGEYMFRYYGVQGNGKNDNTPGALLRGFMHQLDAFITFDIFNAWFSQNKRKIFALNLMVGGGYYWYRNQKYYEDIQVVKTNSTYGIQYMDLYRGHTNTQNTSKMSSYEGDGVILAGATFEFNLSRSIALGIRGVYNMSVHDVLDGRARGNNNDGVFDVNAILRWKIGAKYHSHVRNMTPGMMNTVLATSGNKGGNGAGTGVGGGHRVDTLYIYSKDTVVIQSEQTIMQVPQGDYAYVYFPHNSSVLDEQGLVTIQQTASRMNRDRNLFIVVIGYCDNTGSEKYNKQLGETRAAVVTDELVSEYGIDKARILPVSRGIIHGKRSGGAYGPNRRTEIQFMTLEQFEAEKQKIEDEKSEVEKLMDNSEEIVVTESTTLVQLGRDYYNNMHTWVYIYLANQDQLKSPNALEIGLPLRIPYLNEQQKQITADRAAELYRNVLK